MKQLTEIRSNGGCCNWCKKKILNLPPTNTCFPFCHISPVQYTLNLLHQVPIAQVLFLQDNECVKLQNQSVSLSFCHGQDLLAVHHLQVLHPDNRWHRNRILIHDTLSIQSVKISKVPTETKQTNNVGGDNKWKFARHRQEKWKLKKNLGKNLYKLPCWYYHSLRLLHNISSIYLSSGRTILYDLSHF